MPITNGTRASQHSVGDPKSTFNPYRIFESKMSKGVDRVRTQGILFDMDGTLLGTCTPREEKTEGHRLDTGRRDDLARFLRAAWA
jgi:hypothetical protein